MKYLTFIVKQAYIDLKRNKIRTFLTSLGILIGISSVILLISLGLGLKNYIENQFQSLGTNLLMILPGKSLKGGFSSGMGMMGGARFDESDVLHLEKIKNVSLVAPMSVNYLEVKAEGNAQVYEVVLGTPELFPVMNIAPSQGELFRKSDSEKGTKVAVLGANPAKKLFGNSENALGKTVKINNLPFKVIGIAQEKGGGFATPSMDDHVFISFKAGMSFNPSKKFFTIYMKIKDEALMLETKNNVNEILNNRYSEDDFTVSDQKEMLDIVSSIFNILNLVLTGIASISLIVGGIGIMNIMYVSVAEKINEIGIRRAIGATQKDILYIFLIEALLLSIVGGSLGLSLSFFSVELIKNIFPASISLQSVFLALGISSAIGIIFGILPAQKAAKLSPIEAIRHE